MLIYQILGGALACVLSALTYRCGGMSKDPATNPKWIPMWARQRWMRDWVCPLFTYGALLLFWQPSSTLGYLLLIPSYGILGLALTTYWDWVPFNKGKDNFYMAGFFCGLASILLIFAGLSIWFILARSIFLALFWGGMNWYLNKYAVEYRDVIEEMSRGFLLVI